MATFDDPEGRNAVNDFRMTACLFGCLRFETDCGVLNRFETRSTGLLLAYLILHPDQTHSRENLAFLLWPDADGAAARHSLKQALYALRRELGHHAGIVGADRFTIWIDSEQIVSDVSRFKEELSRAARTDDPNAKLDALETARELYRGPLLPGFEADWVCDERDRLQSLHLKHISELASLKFAAGDVEEAIACARKAIFLDRLNEERYLSLLKLLVWSGRREEADRLLSDLERTLIRHTGSGPSRHLLQSADLILEQGRQTGSASTETQRVRLGVPTPTSKLFGREEDLQVLEKMLSEPGERHVSLVGAGGSGKTRLAVEAANRFGGCFGDIKFISVSANNDEGVANQIVLALTADGNVANPNKIQQVLSSLELPTKGRTLLVLDNCDYAGEATATLLEELLSGSPAICLLATSRSPMGVSAETVMRVGPLSVPEEDFEGHELVESPSVALFVDRARSAHLGFVLNERNQASICRICRKLEGLPLAIELAAAWAHVLSPEQMERQLTSRFALLVTQKQNIPERHRTLWATIDYGFRLLNEDEQKTVTHLSIFKNGFSAEAASEVLGPIGDARLLRNLVDRSFLTTAHLDVAGEGVRYGQMEAVREFMIHQLSSEIRLDLQSKHAHYYCFQAQVNAPLFQGEQQVQTIAETEADYDNYVTVFEWCLAKKEIALGLELAVNLNHYWRRSGKIDQGRKWLETFLNIAPPTSEAFMLRAYDVLAKACTALGDAASSEAALAVAFGSLTTDTPAGIEASICLTASHLALRKGDIPAADNFVLQAFALEAQLEPALRADIRMLLGVIEMNKGRFDESRNHYFESIKLNVNVRNYAALASTYNNLGFLETLTRDWTAAVIHLESCFELTKKIGFKPLEAIAQHNYAVVLYEQQRYGLALLRLKRAIPAFWRFGDKFHLLYAVLYLGAIACEWGRYETATRALAFFSSRSGENVDAMMMRELYSGLVRRLELVFGERALAALHASAALSTPLELLQEFDQNVIEAEFQGEESSPSGLDHA